MSELWFVGVGLTDERDLSRRAIEVARSCDAIFAEEYTSVLAGGSLERLAAELGRPIVRLDRPAVESEAPVLAALGRHRRVAFLTAGDPFGATTHVALRLAAERAGHVWHYLPGASVLTAAAGYLGLIHYRFGRTVSIPFPEPNFSPTSPLEALARNRAAGLHTLVLLDLRPEAGRYLTAGEAIRVLRERGGADPETRFPGTTPVAVVARVGGESARAWYGPAEELQDLDFGPPLHALVVPALPLHEQEAAALERFRLVARGPARPADEA